MKHLAIFIILFNFNCILISAKKTINYTFYNCSLIIDDFLWIAKTEVSNFEYREFINNYRSDNNKTLLPDTSLWKTKIGFSEPYEKYYFRHPAYNNYPVVNISKKNARHFCLWLTKKINLELINNYNNPVKRVIVRLPTEREWQYSAIGGLSQFNELPWDGKSLRIEEGKDKGKIRLNFKRSSGDFMGVAGNLNDAADITAPVKSYWPNGYDLYNMCGNVSEFVDDKEYAYGGNWSSDGFNIKIRSKIKAEASSLIGFRYVIEVIEWKPVDVKKKKIVNKRFFTNSFNKVNDTLYIMECEVTNDIYNLFIRATNHNRPDSLLWNECFWYANQYTNKYHWHPSFYNYPVVNITAYDVNEFCKWIKKESIKYINGTAEFRLPTENEWMNVARGNLTRSVYYPWGGPYIRNAKGQYMCNYRTYPELYCSYDNKGNLKYNIPENSDPMLGAELDGYYIIAPVKSYFPNRIGIYDMSGNVAEMIENEIYTKGGSWKDEMHKVQINHKEYASAPDPKIGFRLVMIKK